MKDQQQQTTTTKTSATATTTTTTTTTATTTTSTRTTFDYVIVGTGPSAMGLLYGILESYYQNTTIQEQQQPISIAVIERGSIVGGRSIISTNVVCSSSGTNNNNNNNNETDITSTTNATDPSQVPSSTSSTTTTLRRSKDDKDSNKNKLLPSVLLKPSHWYKAAHDSLHEYVVHYPMLLFGNRITELPIGTGLGGTSLINACLCMSPSIKASSNYSRKQQQRGQQQQTQQSQHHKTTTTKKEVQNSSKTKTTTTFFHTPGDEFKLWPEPWKTHLPNEWIPYIQEKIESNGHLYHYNDGVTSSIPYHYEYTSDYDDELSSSSSCSSSPSSQPLFQFQIDRKGTPTLLRRRQVVDEDQHLDYKSTSTSKTTSSHHQQQQQYRQEQKKHRRGAQQFVRSTYYDALLEPLLLKHPSLAKCITWFGNTQVERLLCESKTTTTTKKSERRRNEQSSSSTTSSSYGSGGGGGGGVAAASSNIGTSRADGSKRVIIGVEVSSYSSVGRGATKPRNDDKSNSTNDKYFQIYARHDVILCAGAIETPALLLLDQLEMKRLYQRENEKLQTTLNEDKVHPNNEVSSTPQPQSSECYFVLRGVGRNLRDHVILPRAYLTPPSVWGKRSRATSSPNGIAFIGYLTPRCSESGHDSIEHAETNVFQVAVTDSTGQSFTIPSLVAMALRRGQRHKDERGSGFAKNHLIEGLFVLIKSLLYIALACTPLGWFLQHCTTTTLLILLFPCSTGSVRIVTREQSSAATENGGDNRRKEVIKDSQLTYWTAQEQNRPWRRHMVGLDIDVGYLRDAKDVESLKRGWDACSQLVRTNFVSIFPPSFWKIAEKSWWKMYCCSFSLPYYHFMGTCAMRMSGSELQIDRSYEINATSSHDESNRLDNSEDWVVHPTLCVRNYAGLRVCDASVIPTIISSPPALTLSAIGYGLGKILVEK